MYGATINDPQRAMRDLQNAAYQQPKATLNIGVLGETRGLEEDLNELEMAVARAESLLRGTDYPSATAAACPTPSALVERLNSARQRVQMVKLTLDRLCVELSGN